jgi:hypothetical protein
VVGVVSNVKQFTLDGAATADLYVPLDQMPTSQAPLLASRLYWVLRTQGDAHSIAARVRHEVQAVDPDVATSSVQTLDEIIALSLGAWRVNVRLLEVFGQVSVVLCAVGVYAVAAFSARIRRRELAIRTAFGCELPRAHRIDAAGRDAAGIARSRVGIRCRISDDPAARLVPVRGEPDRCPPTW